MNNTLNGTFQKGNEIATAKAGKKHNATIVKELLSKNISNVDNRLYEITLELLNSKSIKIRAFAWKELLKYRLPVKPIIETDPVSQIKVVICTREEKYDENNNIP